MRADLPTGTVTFLFTDVEGSTQLLHELGPDAYAAALAEHQRILRSAFDAHGGREVDTQGDSFFVAFRRAKDAVAAAVDAQRDLGAHTWPEGAEVKVRMGLHTGEPQVGDDRYVGIGVHKASRIGAAGHGGQVLLSRTTRELVEDELPPGVTIRDLGERRLKDLNNPERLSQLVIEGLPSQFGALKTLDVEVKRKRRRMYVGAALIGVLAAAVAIPVLALGRGSGGRSANVKPNSVAVIDAKSNRVVDSVPVGVRPGPIAVGEGSVWVANTEDETVSRIDARSHRLVRTIPVGEYPSDVAVGLGSAWVAVGGGLLRRISLERNEADEAFLALDFAQSTTPGIAPAPPTSSCDRTHASLTAGGGRLWFACYTDDSADASRIDPRERRAMRVDDALVSSSPVLPQFSDLAFGFGAAWIADRTANAVTQIEATTLRKVRDVSVGRAPEAVVVGFGSVWVANSEDDTVSRFEVSGLEPVVGETVPVVSAPIPVGDDPVDVDVGDDAVWVVNRGDRTVSRIDPKAGKVVATIKLENELVRVAVAAGSVWVTVQEAAQ